MIRSAGPGKRRCWRRSAGCRQVDEMAWWVWILIGAAAVLLIADWIIVMGADPRKWKGGMKDD